MKKKVIILLLLIVVVTALFILISGSNKINRHDLVTRHNIRHSIIDPLNALTVGNGEFAYTTDITGMQSFPEYYESGIPLGTQSQWGWHSFPNPENYSLEDVYKLYWSDRDSIPYAYQFTTDKDNRKNKASDWLRENPHRMHLGLIGLKILKSDSSTYAITDIRNPVQQLDLWKGELTSCFEIDGELVKVITLCHQELDMISFRIESRLLLSGNIKIRFEFPYATHEKFSPGYDMLNPEKHSTLIAGKTENGVCFERILDKDTYFVQVSWKGQAKLEKIREHVYEVVPMQNSNVFEMCCMFSQKPYDAPLPSFSKTLHDNKIGWKNFWESGGAIDFSQCSDPRATELERRIVLSQYLTKIQCSGTLPPQETGLTYNSWHGKFHMEMHWWHAVHFILWGRPELMERQLKFYSDIFDQAKQTARLQKYQGIRWPKMTGPEGRESPSTIGPFLVWQQPHIIYFSELLYEYYDQDRKILDTYKELVFATAEFMASFVRWDSLQQRYILGPPIIPAQECFHAGTTTNPVFELAYWHWALETAQMWRVRSGLRPDPGWQKIIDHLAALPVKDSLYLFTENTPDSYKDSVYRIDHPIVLGISGFLRPSGIVDRKIMENTLKKVLQSWNWETAWGWDFPLAAMNAESIGRPDLAIDLLLKDTPKNRYLLNGHNYQNQNLTVYLPGNGGLLTAVAMMCTSRYKETKSGFPLNGQWKVKYENLHCLY
jgi:hypothetical protein